MILYKMVDLCDLTSIMRSGILPADVCRNYNWDDGKRAENSYSVVYLFLPRRAHAAFPEYGVVLLEVDVPDERVSVNNLSSGDCHDALYTEYIIDKVEPNQILRVFIPLYFQPRIEPKYLEYVPSVSWCHIKASVYDEDFSMTVRPATDEELEQFSKTADFVSTSTFNFFRGERHNRTVIDLYDVFYY